jgi:hypothetical protein
VPDVLSVDEGVQFLEATSSLKRRAELIAAYARGLKALLKIQQARSALAGTQ